MKMLKLTTKGSVSVVDASHDLNDLYKLIGNGCDMIEVVKPVGLYLGGLPHTYNHPLMSGFGPVMVVDEEGKYRGCEINPIATRLYLHNYNGSLTYGNAIVGDVIITGLGRFDFEELPEDMVEQLVDDLTKVGAHKED